jgi:hypothetical protein
MPHPPAEAKTFGPLKPASNPFEEGPNGEPLHLEDMQAARVLNAHYVRRHIRHEHGFARARSMRRPRSSLGRTRRPGARRTVRAHAPPGSDDPGGDDPPGEPLAGHLWLDDFVDPFACSAHGAGLSVEVFAAKVRARCDLQEAAELDRQLSRVVGSVLASEGLPA